MSNTTPDLKHKAKPHATDKSVAEKPADAYLPHKDKSPVPLKKNDPDGALDEALKESFPASDPVAVSIAKPVKAE